LALASRGPTLGIELDPATAWLAAANLRAATAESTAVSVTFSSTVAAADATRSNLAAAAAWHIDPDRRPTGRRTSQPHRSRPDPPEIEALLAANPNGAVKLSPAARPPNAWETRAELEWLSRQGECRQLVAWFGSLAEQPGRRRATLVDGRGQALRTLAEPAGPVPEPPVAALGPFVFEPDAAVLAAGLSAALAAEHGLARLAPGVAYFTGPEPVSDPALAAFEVLEELPCDGKRLQSVCRQRRVGRIEVKQRGVGLDPARLQAELSGHGELEATLLLHRGVAGMRAILARRCQRGRGG
jgi:hypothetical protein